MNTDPTNPIARSLENALRVAHEQRQQLSDALVVDLIVKSLQDDPGLVGLQDNPTEEEVKVALVQFARKKYPVFDETPDEILLVAVCKQINKLQTSSDVEKYFGLSK